jgi:TraL protein
MNNKCLYIPRIINEEYVFIWKRDGLIFLMMPWLLMFAIGGIIGFILTLVVTIVVAQLLKQLSVDKPSGYVIHWVKYNIPKQFVSATLSRKDDLEMKSSMFFRGESFPPSYIRHLAG